MNHRTAIKKFPELVDVYEEFFQSFKIQNHASVENAICSLLNITKSYFQVFTKKLNIQRAKSFTIVLKTLIIHLHIRFTGLNKISQNIPSEQNLFLELLSSLLDFFLFLSQNNKPHIKNAIQDLLLFTGNCPRNIAVVLLKCSLVKKKYSDCCRPLLQYILQHKPIIALPPRSYIQYIFLYRLWKICCTSYAEKHKILCLATKLKVSPEETVENKLFIEKIRNCFLHYHIPFSVENLYSPEYWIMKKFPPGFFQDIRKILCDNSVSFHQHKETSALKSNAHKQDTEKADDDHDDLGGSVQFKQLFSTDMTCSENDFSNTDYFVGEMEGYGDLFFAVDNKGRTNNEIQKNISIISPIEDNKTGIEKLISVSNSKGLKRKLVSSQNRYNVNTKCNDSQGKANQVTEINIETDGVSVIKKIKQNELSDKLYDEKNSNFVLKNQNDTNDYGEKYLFESKKKKRKKYIDSDVHGQNDEIKEFSLSQQEFQGKSFPPNITQVQQNLFEVSLKSYKNSNDITVVNEEKLKIPIETEKNNKNRVFSTNTSETIKLDEKCTSVILNDKDDLQYASNKVLVIDHLGVPKKSHKKLKKKNIGISLSTQNPCKSLDFCDTFDEFSSNTVNVNESLYDLTKIPKPCDNMKLNNSLNELSYNNGGEVLLSSPKSHKNKSKKQKIDSLHVRNKKKKLHLSDKKCNFSGNGEIVIEKLHVNTNETSLNSSNNIAVFDDSLNNLDHNIDKAFLLNSASQSKEYENENCNVNLPIENEGNGGLDSLQMLGEKHTTTSDGEINIGDNSDNCESQEKRCKQQEVHVNLHLENEGKNGLYSTQTSHELCTPSTNEINIEISSMDSSGTLLKLCKNYNNPTIVHDDASTLKYENSDNQLTVITSELQQENCKKNLCINSCEISPSFQRLSNDSTISRKNNFEHVTGTFITENHDNVDLKMQETILFHSIPKKEQPYEKSNKLGKKDDSCMENNTFLLFQQQFQNSTLPLNIDKKVLQYSSSISSENCSKSLNGAINDEKSMSIEKDCETAEQGSTHFPEEEKNRVLFDNQSSIQTIEESFPLNNNYKIRPSCDNNGDSDYDNLLLTEMESKICNFGNTSTSINKLLSTSPLKETNLNSLSSNIDFCVKFSQNSEKESVNQLPPNNDEASENIVKNKEVSKESSLHEKEITNDNTSISIIEDCGENEQGKTCLMQEEKDKFLVEDKSNVETTEELSLSNETKKYISYSDSSDNSDLDLPLSKLLPKIESTYNVNNTGILTNIPFMNNQHEPVIKKVSSDIQDSSVDTVNVTKTYHVYMLGTPNEISKFIIADETTNDTTSKSFILNKESKNANEQHSILGHKLIERNQCSNNTQSNHREILQNELNVNDESNFNANICEVFPDVSSVSQEVEFLNANVLKCNEASSKVDSLISSVEKEHTNCYNSNCEICKDAPIVDELHIQKITNNSPKVLENSVASSKNKALFPAPILFPKVNFIPWKCDGPDFSDICKKMDFGDEKTALLNTQIKDTNSLRKLTGKNRHGRSEEFEDDEEFQSINSSDCESQALSSPYKIKKSFSGDSDKNCEFFQNVALEENCPNCKTVVNFLKNININSSTNVINAEVCGGECICQPLTPISQSTSLPETAENSELSEKKFDDKNTTPKRYNLRSRQSLIVPAKFK